MGERDCQLGVHHRVVPGSEATLGACQVAQALAGGAQRDTGPQPGRGDGKIRDRPGPILGQDPGQPSHHECVGVLHRHLGGGGGQERQPGKALRSPPISKKSDRQHTQRRVPQPGRHAADPRRAAAPFNGLPDPSRLQAQPRHPAGRPSARGRLPDPVVSLPRLAQPGLTRGEPASVEIQRAQQQVAPCARPSGHPGGQDTCLGHLTVGDQDLQRVQQPAIGRRRLAADRRSLRQPACRLRRPAQASSLPARRLQLIGQRVVRAGRRRHPVPQRPMPIQQARGPLVQPTPPRRAQVLIDGAVHQQVGKPDPGRGPARLLGQDPRVQRLSQGRQRILQPGHRRRGRELAATAKHRGRCHQLPSRHAQHTHPRQHRTRHRPWYLELPAVQVGTLRHGLFQHRPAEQQVTAGLLQQTADRPARQLPGP